MVLKKHRDVKKDIGYFSSFDDTKVYYEVRGEGEPLVFVYGIACTMNHWLPQVKEFSQKYQVITLDYRGHHLSEIPSNRDNLTIDAIAEDINELLKHLNIKSATFLGHSFGVQNLIRAYDLYPELFKKLILINGFVANPIKGMFGSDLPTTAFQLLKQGYQKVPETSSLLWRALVSNPITMHLSALAGGFNIELTSYKDIEIYTRGVANMDLDVFLRFFEQMMNYDGHSVLKKIKCPTLILSGLKDTVTPREFQESLHKEIKSSEWIQIPYGSHCTQLDLPEFVNLRIEKFLNSPNKL